MSSTDLKSHLIYWGFIIYAIASLGTMATMSIGVVLFLVLLVFGRGNPKIFFSEFRQLATPPPTRSYFLASIFLSIACFISIVTAQVHPLSYHQSVVSVHWIKDLGKIWYFFLPLFFTIGWRQLTNHQRHQVIRTWLFTFGLVSFVGVIQFFTGWPRANPIPQLPGRFLTVLFFGHHLSVASIWIFPFFASLDFGISADTQKKLNLPRWVFAILISLGAFCLFFSWSRTLWLAMPFSLLLWIFLKISKKTAGILATLSILIGVALYNVPTIQDRLKSGSGTQTRIELWQANIDFMKNRPWTGVGLGKNQELSLYYFQEKFPGHPSYFIGHAHQLYLEILAGIGIIGALAWLFWIGVILKILFSAYRTPRSTQFAAGALCAWLTFFINGLTQVNFWEAKVLHQVMWITGLTLFWASQNMTEPLTSRSPK